MGKKKEKLVKAFKEVEAATEELSKKLQALKKIKNPNSFGIDEMCGSLKDDLFDLSEGLEITDDL